MDQNVRAAKNSNGGSFFEDNFPVQAKLYITTVILAGLSIFFYCLYRSMAQADFRWLYLAAFTVLGSCFPVKIPLLKVKKQSLTITVSDVFIFVAILFLGPVMAVTLAVLEGLTSSLRVRVKRLYKQLFNMAQLATVAFVVGKIFLSLRAPMQLESLRPSSLMVLAVEMVLCGLLYFLLNSGFVAFAIALVTHQQFSELWSQNFLWALPADSAHALTAATVFILVQPVTLSIVVALIPILGVAYYARRVKLARDRQGIQT
ncbi:MAG TPA: hypothetical protein VGQ81_15810 [Acidobacteriota bacterium]|jgi:hypothetical protein|nr:hypothetical protein [Acidobacteriota bacterium]